MFTINQSRAKLTIDSTTKSGYSDFVPCDYRTSTSRISRAGSRLAALFVFAVAFAFVNVSSASANPVLRSTRTATSSSGNPDQIVFQFDTPIERFGIALLRSGTRVPATDPQRSASPNEAIVPIGDLPDGAYQLIWEASGTDGTKSSGSLSFVVTSEADPPATQSARRTTTAPPATAAPTNPPATTLAPAPANVTAPAATAPAVVTAPTNTQPPVATAPPQPATQTAAPTVSLRPATARPPATTPPTIRPATITAAPTVTPAPTSPRTPAPSPLPATTNRPANTRPPTTLQPPQGNASNRVNAPNPLPPVVAAPSETGTANPGNAGASPAASAGGGTNTSAAGRANSGASAGSVRANQVAATTTPPPAPPTAPSPSRTTPTTLPRAVTVPSSEATLPTPTTPTLDLSPTAEISAGATPTVLGTTVQNASPPSTRTRPQDDTKPKSSIPLSGQLGADTETGLPTNGSSGSTGSSDGNATETSSPEGTGDQTSGQQANGSEGTGSNDSTGDSALAEGVDQDSGTSQVALPSTDLPSLNQVRGGFNAFARTQLFTVLAWIAMVLALLWALFGRRPAQFLARRLQQLSGATIAASVVLALAGVIAMLNSRSFSPVSLARIVGLIAVISFAALRFGILRRALPLALTARASDEALPRSLRVDEESSPGRWRHSGRLTRRVRKACWTEILFAGLAIALAFFLAFAR